MVHLGKIFLESLWSWLILVHLGKAISWNPPSTYRLPPLHPTALPFRSWCFPNRAFDLIGTQKCSHANRAKVGQTYLRDLLALLGLFYGTYHYRASRKAPQNYSSPFWTYNFSICLCERPKPNMCMISRFLRPVGALIYGFEYTKITSNLLRKYGNHFSKVCLQISKYCKSKIGTVGKVWGSTN